ncbi:MAG: MinD/ParA family protein [Candidatus Eisenbacteria bacterium]|nr:MinD/ParA family protein [Candidatus Eisenbacteria bacterium]
MPARTPPEPRRPAGRTRGESAPDGGARRSRAAGEGTPPLRVMPGRARAGSAAAGDHPAHWTRPRGRTVVVASGKGGVGKSNLCANLAVALGEAGARVLLLDGDLSQASLDLLLGLHPRYDLQHVLSGEKTLEEIVVTGPRGVKLIPAASGVPELADLDDYRRECLLRGLGALDGEADIVLMDTASGVSRQVTSFCLAADDVLVMTTPEMPAFSDAYGLIKLLQGQGLRKAPHLLVSQAASPEEAEETAHRIRLVARRFLRLEIEAWGHVPEDAAVPRAVRRQEPVVTAFPQSPAAAAYRALAARLLPPAPDPSFDEHSDPAYPLAGLRGGRQRLEA